MENRTHSDIYQRFLQEYDQTKKDAIWSSQTNKFKQFCHDGILSDSKKEINDQEIDGIIRILDRHWKGNTKESEAIRLWITFHFFELANLFRKLYVTILKAKW